MKWRNSSRKCGRSVDFGVFPRNFLEGGFEFFQRLLRVWNTGSLGRGNAGPQGQSHLGLKSRLRFYGFVVIRKFLPHGEFGSVHSIPTEPMGARSASKESRRERISVLYNERTEIILPTWVSKSVRDAHGPIPFPLAAGPLASCRPSCGQDRHVAHSARGAFFTSSG